MGNVKAGRTITTYTHEWADAFCLEISSGVSLKKICRRPNQPAKTTVFKWLSQKPDFAAKYARAKGSAMDAMAEEVLELSDSATKEDWQVKRLQVETRKWLMGKLNASKYSDKVTAEIKDINVNLSAADKRTA